MRTKARKGRLALHDRFLAGVAIARCKIRDIYCSRFATRIRGSGQFNGEEFPSVRKIAFVMYLRDGLVSISVSRMSKSLGILEIPKTVPARSKAIAKILCA